MAVPLIDGRRPLQSLLLERLVAVSAGTVDYHAVGYLVIAVFVYVRQFAVLVHPDRSELVLSYCVGQQSGDLFREELFLQDLLDRGSRGGVAVQHLRYNFFEVVRLVGRDRGVCAPKDFQHQPFHRVGVERMLERHHLLKDAA